MKNIIIALSILVIGFVIGLVCRKTEYVENTIVERDTTVVVDTHIVEKPVPYKVTVTDTLYVIVTDVIVKNDTTYVALPLEKREYRRDEFYAVVAGYEPRLIHMEVYPKTVYVTETQREFIRQRNYLAAGAELLYADAFHTYIYAEYERMLHKNVGIYGRFLYDISTGSKGGSLGVKYKFGW